MAPSEALELDRDGLMFWLGQAERIAKEDA
jgi:hypothetical protein